MSVGMLTGYVVDAVFGDPKRGHPVAAFGRAAAALEQVTYARSRPAGAVHTAALVGGAVALGVAANRLPRPLRTAALAASTWAVLGGQSLQVEGDAMSQLLRDGDLPAARVQIRNLVGRDPSNLDADELARATVESIAENTADAVTAPLWWGAVAGIPGLLGYRAINTLDAMIGHRNRRYREFGWAAAKLDDAANWVPARLTVAATAATTGYGAGIRRTYAVVTRDAPKHPSPNAGPVEAAFAAVLGRQLGGRNQYDGVDEDRGTLGDGAPVGVADIERAVRLHTKVSLLTAAAAIGSRAVVSWAWRRARR